MTFVHFCTYLICLSFIIARFSYDFCAFLHVFGTSLSILAYERWILGNFFCKCFWILEQSQSKMTSRRSTTSSPSSLMVSIIYCGRPLLRQCG